MHSDADRARDAVFARSVTAMGHPVRLDILRAVRTPKALREIVVHARDDTGHERALSRQAVREHLERLVDVGLVVMREAEREYGETVEYVLNNQTVFAMAEEMRALARLRPTAELDLPTIRARPDGRSAAAQGPRLVLVRGIDEGRVFPLEPSATGPWLVGRRRDADVALDFDPFVSTDHAHIVRVGREFAVEDAPDSRNGTFVNFEEIPKGTRRALRHGDVVGVGRCLLLFRE